MAPMDHSQFHAALMRAAAQRRIRRCELRRVRRAAPAPAVVGVDLSGDLAEAQLRRRVASSDARPLEIKAHLQTPLHGKTATGSNQEVRLPCLSKRKLAGLSSIFTRQPFASVPLSP